MIKGTTPTHIFTIPFDTSVLDKVKITYAQNDAIVLTKTTENCALEENKISVTLTQEDTFAFDHKKAVEIQLRVLTKNGEVLTSLPEKVGVAKCLDDEVLV